MSKGINETFQLAKRLTATLYDYYQPAKLALLTFRKRDTILNAHTIASIIH